MKVIKIKDEDYKKLEDHKIHPRQPFWEIIKNHLNKKEVSENVNNDTKPSV